jgi:hypothetical protein
MGMYDELECHYPLPDGWDPTGHVFQTKDTPEQWLQRYVLTADGVLVCADTQEPILHHGALTFYTDNIRSLSGKWLATVRDEPPWEAEYVALFDHGTLLKLEGEKRPVTSHTHITQAALAAFRDARRTAADASTSQHMPPG